MNILPFENKTNTFTYLNELLKDEFKHMISIGDYTYGEIPNIRYWGGEYRLHIGKFCSIADNLKIFLGGNHQIYSITTYPLQLIFGEFNNGEIKKKQRKKNFVNIGNDIWIGSNVTILSGVTLGDGCIIGAGTLVSKDVPSYSIFCGNPGRVVKYRFDQEIIKMLLEIQWWDWDIKIINNHLKQLTSEPTIELIEKLKLTIKS